ncbi:fimbrial biogenesis chaperone [Marinomonas gallaica]|uniref:fimbrial biogenesis chaperone n=1 Tax=Marinomonas gallaica TaxID=1806667 RepID=UPI00082A64F2|nr:fimbria/pilus periplasmic chaperone [Marinomonas gallaica]
MIYIRPKVLIKSALLVTIGLIVATQTYASLLISPVRSVLSERDRTQVITLINTGNETRSYRVEWRQLIAVPEGGYREYTEEEKKRIAGLEKIVRVTPKQVSLQPGQRQSVKVLLRKPESLAEGEYRSHLSFVALPLNSAQENNQSETSLKLQLLMSYSMPVIYRVGSVFVNPQITDISLVHKKQTGTTNIKVDLFHDDLFSTHGRLIAFWTPKNGQTRQVGLLNGYNFYPETKNATTQFPWQDFKLEPGTLEVRYEGQSEFAGLLLSQKMLTITQQMVNSVR